MIEVSIHFTLPEAHHINQLRKAGKIKMGRKMVEIDIETAERLIASEMKPSLCTVTY